mmetsp:Transcript_18643/g.42908  ORF Transcript_18643/g.42908 Transcript_18643/m.42908 type:complete len:247 (+) Transcript_18643:360-1100(+)
MEEGEEAFAWLLTPCAWLLPPGSVVRLLPWQPSPWPIARLSPFPRVRGPTLRSCFPFASSPRAPRRFLPGASRSFPRPPRSRSGACSTPFASPQGFLPAAPNRAGCSSKLPNPGQDSRICSSIPRPLRAATPSRPPGSRTGTPVFPALRFETLVPCTIFGSPFAGSRAPLRALPRVSSVPLPGFRTPSPCLPWPFAGPRFPPPFFRFPCIFSPVPPCRAASWQRTSGVLRACPRTCQWRSGSTRRP